MYDQSGYEQFLVQHSGRSKEFANAVAGLDYQVARQIRFLLLFHVPCVVFLAVVAEMHLCLHHGHVILAAMLDCVRVF